MGSGMCGHTGYCASTWTEKEMTLGATLPAVIAMCRCTAAASRTVVCRTWPTDQVVRRIDCTGYQPGMWSTNAPETFRTVIPTRYLAPEITCALIDACLGRWQLTHFGSRYWRSRKPQVLERGARHDGSAHRRPGFGAGRSPGRRVQRPSGRARVRLFRGLVRRLRRRNKIGP